MSSSIPTPTPAAVALVEPGAVEIGARIGHLLIDDALAEGPARLTDAELVEQVDEWDRLARRVDAVQLVLVAEVDKRRVAQAAGFAGTDAWLAKRTRRDHSSTAAGVKLARAVASSAKATGSALGLGTISPDHAQVIVAATANLPARLTPQERETVETVLVERAQITNPKTLRQLARRALEVVEAEQAAVDAHEEALVRAEEDAARSKTRLTLHDNEDGTTSGPFTVPTLQASMLRRILDSMTARRRAHVGAPAAQAGSTLERTDWAHARGLAFIELLEHLPTDHLRGKVPATLVVTIDHAKLVEALSAAGVVTTDTADSGSAGRARRLAGGAGILPAILNRESLPVDVGRTKRLFTETQRVALATRHHTCSADGCERPFAWCELHHHQPFAAGGATDLANAVPVCNFHHQRLHDPAYDHQRQPDGSIRFHRRT